MDDVKVSDMEHLAVRLEEEMPYKTVSNVLKHEGWLDLLETLRKLSPSAYEAMRKDLLCSLTNRN